MKIVAIRSAVSYNFGMGQDFKESIAIVTGGTSGIGKEISRQFLERGDKVIAIYASDDKKAQEAQSEFNNANFSIVKLDITDETAVKGFFSKLDKCDCLINCAAITIEAPFEELPIIDIKKVIDVNLFGAMSCAKYALPLLKKSNCARIVNIASRFAERPSIEGMMGYACSKSALVMMTKVLALEWAKFGVRTNAISPALTLTPMTEAICIDEELAEVKKKNPCARLGKTSDIANMVMFLCGEKSDYINGENININGGLLLV